MKKLTLFFACAVVGLILNSCASGGETETQKIAHNVMLVQPIVSGSSQVRTYSAMVQESRSISVGFKTAGQIKRILVKEGDYVRQGQLLAVLDTVDYALGVAQLRVQHAQQCAEYARRAQLHAAHNMSDNDFERFVAGYEQLSSQLALQENKLSYCRLKAPASGYITASNFEVSEMVDAGTPVFELMDDSRLEVVVDLPVAEYLHRGEFLSFTGRSSMAVGETFPLKFVSLTPRADNNQLYRLKLVLADNSAHSKSVLTAGMNIMVDISTGATTKQEVKATTALLPASAVFDHDGHSCVWSFNPADSTVTAVAVAIVGVPDESGFVTVTSGVNATTQVVRAGVHHLVDGEKVRVIEPGSETNVGNLL
jgi:RND family efflux transporter MFP subunit